MRPSFSDWASALELACVVLHNAARIWGAGPVAMLLRRMADRAARQAKNIRERINHGPPFNPQDDAITAEFPAVECDALEEDTEQITQMYGDKSSKP